MEYKGKLHYIKNQKIRSQKYSASQNSNFVKYLSFIKILDYVPDKSQYKSI